MRYKYFSALFSTAAFAGALALSAAPQADDRNYTEQTNVVQTKTTMSDGHLERKIHKAISRDVTMSNRALDVRIISRNGQVILKGSVPTNMEKEKIVAKAEELAGSGNVVDQIKVKHKNYLG
jgi:hyperosmotically inducible protein